MPTSLNRLGVLIQSFREAKGISQATLALAITPKTNRSAIAHLEQGLRLPAPEVLRGICNFLGIPEIVWKSVQIVQYDNAPRLRIFNQVEPQVIAVAGMMGSGKTTLARNLASELGYVYIPESMPAKRYLGDLSSNPDRWAFETQLAFLCYKALQISNATNNGQRIIIDRSLDEDVNIFAKYWEQTGHINERAFETYSALAGYFLSVIKKPDILIYCECSVDTALLRIKERGRYDHKLHSREHLLKIAEMYEKWMDSQSYLFMYKMKSESLDWRDGKSAAFRTAIEKMLHAWAPQSQETKEQQLILFPSEKNFQSSQTDNIGTNVNKNSLSSPLIPSTQSNAITRRTGVLKVEPSGIRVYPSAYIAAPFTSKARWGMPRRAMKNPQLFERLGAHGGIPRGKYRNMLLGIEKSLREQGVSTLLPHRDVNHWGTVSLTPAQVMELCTNHVVSCDIFVGILGESHGSHYEFGVARGMNKPSIIIHCKEIQESFIATGLADGNHSLLVVGCDKMQNIPALLKGDAVTTFLSQFVPLNIRGG